VLVDLNRYVLSAAETVVKIGRGLSSMNKVIFDTFLICLSTTFDE